MNKYYLGVDIGGTFIKMGVVSSNGQIVDRCKVESKYDISEITKIINTYLIKQSKRTTIIGVGISLPGVISSEGIMQTAGALKSLIGLNIKKIVEEALKLPAEIITDSKAVALSEGWLGNGKNYSDYVCITLGSAVGGAIVINNRLYWGLGGLAGEFGVSLMDRSDAEYKLDSTSLHAGVVGGLCRKYSLATDQKITDAALIFSLAKEGDAIAQHFFDEFLDDVARLLVNISVYIAPEAILIGGGISADKVIMDKIQRAYDKIIQKYHVLSLVNMPVILPCKLKNDAGMIGAVKLLIQTQE
ncbi:ROK family protein [Lapidilactobacillus mulanensis]|uniref:ROK family protein n=1 Tax=Lapidilactobacillus mulanensis TaxID=2485999 RepID=A0ABW4DL45_9LACO|nr:ROK family protein [Lapidilactobacillus mulanensis]